MVGFPHYFPHHFSIIAKDEFMIYNTYKIRNMEYTAHQHKLCFFLFLSFRLFLSFWVQRRISYGFAFKQLWNGGHPAMWRCRADKAERVRLFFCELSRKKNLPECWNEPQGEILAFQQSAKISPCGSFQHSGAMPCGHETADTLRFVRPTVRYRPPVGHGAW